MKGKTIFTKIVAVLLVVSCIPPVMALAASPDIQPLASPYLDTHSTQILPLGGGKVQVHFSVTSSSVMDKLGADSIVLYESTDQINWSQVKTFEADTYSSMITKNAAQYSGALSYYGVAGRYYKAYVCIYARKGTNAESLYKWTSVVRAT